MGRGKRQGQDRGMNLELQTSSHKINEEQGYILQQRKLQPLFWNNFKGSTIYKNTELHCYTSDNNITFKIKMYFTKKQMKIIFWKKSYKLEPIQFFKLISH